MCQWRVVKRIQLLLDLDRTRKSKNWFLLVTLYTNEVFVYTNFTSHWISLSCTSYGKAVSHWSIRVSFIRMRRVVTDGILVGLRRPRGIVQMGMNHELRGILRESASRLSLLGNHSLIGW